MKPKMKEVRKTFRLPKGGLEPPTIKKVRKQAKEGREQLRKLGR